MVGVTGNDDGTVPTIIMHGEALCLWQQRMVKWVPRAAITSGVHTVAALTSIHSIMMLAMIMVVIIPLPYRHCHIFEWLQQLTIAISIITLDIIMIQLFIIDGI